MSNTKFTKGEWVADIRTGCCAVYEKSRESDTYGVSEYDDRNIYYSSSGAKFNGYNWIMSEEAIANAHLIAAAPEMYEMLEKIAKATVYNHNYETARPIFELLAKARGESCK